MFANCFKSLMEAQGLQFIGANLSAGNVAMLSMSLISGGLRQVRELSTPGRRTVTRSTDLQTTHRGGWRISKLNCLLVRVIYFLNYN